MTSKQYNPKIHHRRSIRLNGYDYSRAGLYFVTICTKNHANLFGTIVNHEITLNDAGKMILARWQEIPIYYNKFAVHEFVVMPNHIHGIIEIIPVPVGAGPRACPNHKKNQHIGQPQGVAPTGLPDMMCRFKTLTTKQYIDGVQQNGWQRFDKKLWQRNYWEHIIRNENGHALISQYIMDNPIKWESDELNCE